MKALLKNITLTLLFLLGLFLGGICILLSTQRGQQWCTAQIAHQIQEATGYRTVVSSTRGELPFFIEFGGIELFEPEETQSFARMERLSCWWSPIHLLFGQIHFSRVSLQDCIIHHTPRPANPSTPSPAPSGTSSFWIPKKFIIASLHFHRLSFSETLPYPLDIKGRVDYSFSPSRAVLDLSIKKYRDWLSPTRLVLTYSPNKKVPLEVALQEKNGGVLSNLLSLPSHPGFTLSSSLSNSNNERGIAGTLNLAFSDLDSFSALPEIGHQLLGPYLTYSSEFEWTSPSLLLKSIQLKSPQLSVCGQLQSYLTSSSITGDLDLELYQISTLLSSKSPSHPLQTHFCIGGTLQQPTASFDFHSKTLFLDAIPFHELQGSGEWNWKGEEWAFTTQVRGQLGGHSLQSSLALTYNERGLWSVNQWKGTWGPGDFSGEGTWASSTGIFKGEFQGSSLDLGISKYLSELPVGGLADLQLKVENQRGVPTVHYQISADKIYTSQFNSSQNLLQGSCADPWGSRKGSMRLQLQHVEFPQHWPVNEVEVELSHMGHSMDFQVQAKNKGHSPLHLHSQGALSLTKEGFLLTLSHAEGIVNEKKVELKNSLSIYKNEGHFQISPFSLQLGEGLLEGSLSQKKSELDLYINLDEVPLSPLCVFPYIPPLEGSLSGQLQWNFSPERAQGSCRATLHHFRFRDLALRTMPSIHGSLQTHLEGNTLYGTVKLEGDQEGEDAPYLYTSIELPLLFEPSHFTPQVPPHRDLRGVLRARGEVAPFIQGFTSDINRLAGKVHVDFHFVGTPQNLQLSGHTKIREGSYESLMSGASLTHISADLEGVGPQLVLEKFQARGGQRGRIQAKGTLDLLPAKQYPYSIQAQLQSTPLINLDLAQGLGTGILDLKGSLKEAFLSGSLIVSQARLEIPDEMHDPIQTLNVQFINSTVQKKKSSSSQVATHPQLPVHLDIALETKGGLSLQGRGLTSDWSGQIALQGTLKNPEVYGQLRANRGKFAFAGKDFALTRGAITMGGEPGSSTTLHLSAVHSVQDTDVILSLIGPLKSMRLDIKSSPQLSTREILSLILFNQNITNITPLQQIQLAQTAMALAGGKFGPDVMGTLQRNIGLDRLTLRSGGNHKGDLTDLLGENWNDSASDPLGIQTDPTMTQVEGEEETVRDPSAEVYIEAGKYLTDHVFLSVSKGVNSDGYRVAVEASLSHSLSVEAEIAKEGDAEEDQSEPRRGVSLLWKKDY